MKTLITYQDYEIESNIEPILNHMVWQNGKLTSRKRIQTLAGLYCETDEDIIIRLLGCRSLNIPVKYYISPNHREI